jgi:polyhydroxyalkanoate synthesis regulator phasin
VHGDLSKFRRDLAEGSGAEAEAIKGADKFTKAWADRVKQGVNEKWASIVDAMYSDKKLDWDRMIGAFDSRNLDEAETKITEFMDKMKAAGKLTQDQFDGAKKSLDGVLEGMREQNRLLDRQEQETRGLGMATDANRTLFAEANAENEKWARTFEGMFKNNQLAKIEEDFKGIAKAMNESDWSKFTNGFDSMQEASRRVRELNALMHEQGRITDENAAKVQSSIDQYIQGEKDKSKAMRDSLDETNRLRKAQDDYNASLSGMARNIHFGELEGQFKQLARAMDSNDWSHFAKGAANANEMQARIGQAADEMHRLGRMSDEELSLVNSRAKEAAGNFRLFSGELAKAEAIMARSSSGGGGGGKFKSMLGGLGDATRGLREHLQGFAGLNVFGDMIEGGLEFLHNLDRIAVSASLTTLKLTTMASVVGSALTALFPIATDLGGIIGGLGAALPAFATGLGIMGFIAIEALGGFAKQYKKEILKFKEDLLKEVMVGLDPALNRFRDQTLPTLKKNLADAAGAMGRMFGTILDAITKNANNDLMTLMFKRMNDAMDKSHVGVEALVHIWAVLGEVGTRFFDRFATGFNDMATQWADFIDKSAANGDIEKWINNMIDGFKDLFRAFDGAFGIINAVSDAARAAGFGGLKTFADALQNAAAAMQSIAFQKTLSIYLEGMHGLVGKLGDALKGLGPAAESFAPTALVALGSIGDAVSKLIGYVGDIFKNPAFQLGVNNFTAGIADAVRKLEPAVKPFGDSLGNALTLLGMIVGSVAGIATAFTVTLGPVLDNMSAKMQTLVQPLADAASKLITDMKGPLDAINREIVGPLVEGIRDKLLPALTGPGGFTEKFGDFATKVITDIGPSFRIVVNEVLPNLVKVATEVLGPLGSLVDLLSPTLAATVGAIGTALGNMANDIKVLKSELPITELSIFKAFSPEVIQKQIEQESVKPQRWSEILAIFFTKNIQTGMELAWTEKIYPAIVKADDWVWDKATDAIDKLFTGHNTQTDQAQRNRKWVASLFGIPDADQFDKDVNQWFEDNIFKPTREIGPEIGRLWDKTIGSLWDTVFNGKGGGDKGTGSGTGGGLGSSGAGGRGRGVTGKLDPNILVGTPADTETAWKTWGDDIIGRIQKIPGDIWQGFLDGFNSLSGGATGMVTAIVQNFTGWVQSVKDFFGIASPSTLMLGMAGDIVQGFIDGFTDIGTRVGQAWANVGTTISTKVEEIKTNLVQFGTEVQTNWDLFWGGLGTTIQTKWTEFTTWISTTTEQIKTNLAQFGTDVSTNWNTFWGDVGTFLQTKWTEFTTWVSTKTEEIKTNIATFGETVKTNWNTFWTDVGTTIQTKWTEFTTAISTKAEEIRTNLSTFGENVKTNWNNFWTEVGNKVSTAWEGIKSGVTTGIENVMTSVRELPGKITGAFSNMWQLMSDVGNNIANGLKAGIDGGVKWVTDAATTLANAAVDAANTALGNKSPSKVFRQIGLFTGEGYVQGMNLSEAPVALAAASMAAAATGGMQAQIDPLRNTMQAMVDALTGPLTADLSQSQMYITGRDAAQGLADGLKANRSAVHTALGTLGAFTVPSQSVITVSGAIESAVGRPSAESGNHLTIAQGAINITTPTQNPELVAAKVIDGFSNFSSF